MEEENEEEKMKEEVENVVEKEEVDGEENEEEMKVDVEEWKDKTRISGAYHAVNKFIPLICEAYILQMAGWNSYIVLPIATYYIVAVYSTIMTTIPCSK